MKLIAVYSRCIGFCFLLSLFRTSTQIYDSTDDINVPMGCNQTIQIDILTSHTLRVQSSHCFNCEKRLACQQPFPIKDCLVTYTAKTDFIRHAYKICSSFDGRFDDCDGGIKISSPAVGKEKEKFDGKTLSKIASCTLPNYHCSPLHKDLQLTFNSGNICGMNKRGWYLRIKLEHAYSKTFQLHYNHRGKCPRHRIPLRTAMVLSHSQPESISKRKKTMCVMEIAPYFTISSQVELCIQFVDYLFVPGGAKLVIELGEALDSTMIFDSNKLIPQGQICRMWRPTSSIKVKVVPGKDTGNNTHAFLFRYVLTKKGNNFRSPTPSLRPSRPNYVTVNKKTSGVGTAKVFLIFIAPCLVALAFFFIVKNQIKSRAARLRAVTGNSPSSPPASADNDQSAEITFSENPPSYGEVMSHQTYEMNTRTEDSRLDESRDMAPMMNPTLPPTYHSLFSDGK